MNLTFDGWRAADWEIFTIPDFSRRMAAIRSELQPRLIALGELLAEPLQRGLPHPIFPHVARHMRRRVNPPPATWAAWGRDRRGYKRWTHYRLAVYEGGVRFTLFVEDDADDKPVMAAALVRHATRWERGLAGMEIFQPGDAAPVSRRRLIEAGETLQRLKGAHLQIGAGLPSAEAERMKPGEFVAWIESRACQLAPLYVAGSGASAA